MINHPRSPYTLRIIPIDIDETFTPQEKEQLILAIDEWNNSLNNQILLKVNDDHFNMEPSEINNIYANNGFMLLRISENNQIVHNLESDITAMTDGIGGHIIYFIYERIKLSDLRQKAVHELAHLLGAVHSNYGLMRREYDSKSYECIDYFTAEQVAEYNHLNIQTMNWCEK